MLVSGLTADIQMQVVKTAIYQCKEHGLVVDAITMDGHPTNMSMAKKLGCNFTSGEMKTSFQLEDIDHEIFVFMDVCHMLKLARNMLHAYNVIKVSCYCPSIIQIYIFRRG